MTTRRLVLDDPVALADTARIFKAALARHQASQSTDLRSETQSSSSGRPGSNPGRAA